MKHKSAFVLVIFLVLNVRAQLFSGVLTNFWAAAGSEVQFNASGYNSSTNVQLAVNLDTNNLFTSAAATGAGQAWRLSGTLAWDGTNLSAQTSFKSDINAETEYGQADLTNFTPGTNLFSLTATNVPAATIWLVVTNAGDTNFNGDYASQPGSSPTDGTNGWWSNGPIFTEYVWDYSSSSNLWQLGLINTNFIPPEYKFYTPTNPSSGQAFPAELTYGGGSPAPIVWYFETVTTNDSSGFVLSGGGIASSVAIPPATAPAVLSFVPSSAVAPPDLINLSNGVVGWVNSRLYVSALQTNVVMSSSRITIYTTNTFVFSGSNYVGRFAQLYAWQMTVPQKYQCDMCPTTNQVENVWVSYSGSNGWFQATNGFVSLTNISVSIIGEAGGYGSLTLFGLDHPELYGRTNSFDGQNWLVDGSPIASQAYVNTFNHVLSPPVQCADNWIFDSQSPSTTNQTVSFVAFNNTVFQLLSSYTGVHIDNFYLTATATNPVFTVDGYGTTNWFTNYVFGLAGLDVAQTNLPVGWVVEQCTNLTPPIVWAVDTNFTTITNSGELTIRVLHDYTIPCAFFRVRNPVTFSATITAPLTVNGSVTASNFSGSATGLNNANPLTLFPAGPATVLGSNIVVSISNASPATLSLFCVTQANGSLTYAISNAAAGGGGGGAFGGGIITNLQIGQWLLVSNTTDNSLMQTNPTTGVAGTISLTNGTVIVGGRAFNPGVPTLTTNNTSLVASVSLDANAQNNSMTLTFSTTAATQIGNSNYIIITFSRPFPSGSVPHFVMSPAPQSTVSSITTSYFSVSNTVSALYVNTYTTVPTASKVYQYNIIGF